MKRFPISAAAIVVALLLWDLAAQWTASPQVFPRPASVYEAFLEMVGSGELARAVLDSLQRVAVGYALGAAAGVLTGLALGSFRSLNDTVGLVFEFIKGIPPIALVPVAIMWLGVGEGSKYVVIAYIVWIVVGTSTAVGAAEVPLVRVRAGAIFGLGLLQRFVRIVLPSSMPFVLTGLRSAIGFAFVALVSAELIAANSGIGQIIMDSRFALQTSRMIVGLLVLGAIGASIQVAFDALVSLMKANQRYR